MNDILIEEEIRTELLPVSFTESAVKEITRLMQSENIPADHALRVGVKGGGCSGMSYILGFDKKETGDTDYQIDGVHVIMNKSHELYLFGMQIDFQQGLNARGFVFENPNAKKTCGCGSSFSA